MAAEPAKSASVFRELEEERRALLGELAQWPASRLHYRPQADAWTAVEVLDHLVRAEAGTIADLRAGLRNPQVLGGEERPGIAALERALRSDERFKVPAGSASIYPEAQTTFEEVSARWERARTELQLLVGEMEPAHERCGVFRHPFAGLMTVEEVMRHFSDHLYHHRFQIERLRESSAEQE